jgi:hypothetical protein
MKPMIVRISELRQIFDVLMTYCEKDGISELEIEADYYWNIPTEERYDLDQPPDDLDVGQLSHDWERLTAISSGEMPPVDFALGWFGDVLRAVGDRKLIQIYRKNGKG